MFAYLKYLMSFKKIFAVASVCIITIEAIVILIKRNSKKDKIQLISRKMCNVVLGMRDIENPFESLAEKDNDDSQQPIVVKNPDFKSRKVYRNDIISVISTLGVIIVVVIVSIYSFNIRQQKDEILKEENLSYEIAMLQTLNNIENNSTVLSERTDSISFQIKEGIDSLKEIFTKFQKAQKKKK